MYHCGAPLRPAAPERQDRQLQPLQIRVEEAIRPGHNRKTAGARAIAAATDLPKPGTVSRRGSRPPLGHLQPGRNRLRNAGGTAAFHREARRRFRRKTAQFETAFTARSQSGCEHRDRSRDIPRLGKRPDGQAAARVGIQKRFAQRAEPKLGSGEWRIEDRKRVSVRERRLDERLVSLIRLRYNERGRRRQEIDCEENSSGLIVHMDSPDEFVTIATGYASLPECRRG